MDSTLIKLTKNENNNLWVNTKLADIVEGHLAMDVNVPPCGHCQKAGHLICGLHKLCVVCNVGVN